MAKNARRSLTDEFNRNDAGFCAFLSCVAETRCVFYSPALISPARNKAVGLIADIIRRAVSVYPESIPPPSD